MTGFSLPDDAERAAERYCPCMHLRQILVRAREQVVAVDGLIAVALAGLALWEMSSPGRFIGSRTIHAVGILLMTLPLAWRRRAPLTVACIVAVGISGESLLVPVPQSAGLFVAFLLAVYSVAAHTSGRHRLTGTAVLAGAGAINLLRDPLMTSVGAALPSLFIVASAWLVGATVSRREQRAAHLEQRTQRLEQVQAQEAEAAAARERARIARELHDVIAHGLSSIVVQAGAARLELDSDRTTTEQALRSIEETGRQALVELRRLLGLVRKLDDGLELVPQPSLDQLQALVAQLQDTGLPVALKVEGAPRRLAPGVDLSAYRIVQEALTNVLKHAGRVHTEVAIRYGDRELELQITDDGPGANNSGGGHGLIGMQERVAIYGGSMRAGQRSEGGFAVQVRLPIEPSSQ